MSAALIYIVWLALGMYLALMCYCEPISSFLMEIKETIQCYITTATVTSELLMHTSGVLKTLPSDHISAP